MAEKIIDGKTPMHIGLGISSERSDELTLALGKSIQYQDNVGALLLEILEIVDNTKEAVYLTAGAMRYLIATNKIDI